VNEKRGFIWGMSLKEGTYNNTDEWLIACGIVDAQERNDIIAFLSASFIDAPSPGTIDKVWIGNQTFWNSEVEMTLITPPNVTPPENPEMSDEECRLGKYPPFSCYSSGYIVIGDDDIYSDHSPSMVEIEASEE